MAKIPSQDPIEFLLQRRFPIYQSLNIPKSLLSGGRGMQHDEREKKRAVIEVYRTELKSKTTVEIEELVRCEKERHRREVISRLAAEEAARFFNQSDAKADFEHYCKAATWIADRGS